SRADAAIGSQALPDEVKLIAGTPDVSPTTLDGPGSAAQRLAASRGSATHVGATPARRTGRSPTAWELERSDTRPPAAVAGRRVILRRKPERAVVRWVDGHHAVVAPTVEARGLGTGTRDHRGFTLRHCPQWIAAKPAGVANRGRDGRTRDAV